VGPSKSDYLRITLATVRWWIALSAVALLGLYLSGGGLAAVRTWWGFVDAAASRIGVAFPFAAFAAGIAGAALAVRRRAAVVVVMLTSLGLGVISYVAGSLVAPIAEMEAYRRIGVDLQVRYPLGARTMFELVRRRDRLLRSPPAEYSFSVERPLDHPPNWLLYLVHQPIAFVVFGVTNAVLGLLVGWATTGLSPPRRGHTRWALGLASAIAFFVPASAGARWVRVSPESSAVLAAWLPLVVPLVAIALAYAIVRSRLRRDFHADEPLSV
jgi:hypothetical protein